MSFEKFKNIALLSDLNVINDELILASKRLIELKFEKKKNLKINSHLFIHLKRRIAQLNFQKHLVLNKKLWEKNNK